MLDTANLIDVEIDIQVIKGARWDEIHKIVLSHQIIQNARDDFLEGLISFDDYLALCESHNVNVDLFLGTVKENLDSVGVYV